MISKATAGQDTKDGPTVLHIAPTPFFADRGCHIRIANELEALKGETFRIILCTYHHGRDIPGLDIRRIPRVPGYTKLDAGYSPYRVLADLLLLLLVLWTVWRERPVLLHAHLHEGVLIGWLARRLFFWRRMTLIMDMQGSLSGELQAYGTLRKGAPLLALIRKVERCIYRMPQHIFCSSATCREMLLGDFGMPAKRSSVLADTVPEDFFHPPSQEEARSRHGIPLDKTVVLYSGSLLPGKGIDHVLEAMKILAEGHPELFWILIGYPVEQAAAFVEQHGFTVLCRLVGRLPYHQLPGWLATADIALEPKQSESAEASGKVLHYMAASLPVVCFPTVNNRSLLGESGLYANHMDTRSFADALQVAAGDLQRGRSMGRLARQRVRERYSLPALARQLQEAYSGWLA